MTLTVARKVSLDPCLAPASARAEALLRLLLLSFAVLLLSGCATTATRAPSPDDPLEGYNRAVFAFNDGLDRAVLKPLARGYEAVTPQPVKTGLGNFFSNLEDPWIGFNNLLQGKVGRAFSDWMRFALNSTFGIFGLLDIAGEAGIEKHDEDFGQTLAVWGVGRGPYFVLPLFGPSTIRDTAALPVDFMGDPSTAFEPNTEASVRALDIVQTRARLLPAERALEAGTIDRYAQIRDLYLQQRRAKVFDGNPPLEYEDFSAQTSVDAVAFAALRLPGAANQ